MDCSPVEIFKAVKNDVEIAGLRKAGREDQLAPRSTRRVARDAAGPRGRRRRDCQAPSTTSNRVWAAADGVWDVSDSLELTRGRWPPSALASERTDAATRRPSTAGLRRLTGRCPRRSTSARHATKL